MTNQEAAVLEQHHELIETLNHPDPDPDLLPAIIPQDLLTAEQTAAHIIRAMLRSQDDIEQLKTKMEADLQAWATVIAKQQMKVDQWRALVLGWMLRSDVTKIQCPWFTASIGKGRTKKVVQDETQAVAIAKTCYPKAVRVIEKIDKKELDVAVDSFPKLFDGIVTEETSEPTLIVRRKE